MCCVLSDSCTVLLLYVLSESCTVHSLTHVLSRFVNEGFEKNPDGSKGTPLPAVAHGDQVEVLLEEGKFMPGMVESLVGGQTGEKKLINITFPKRPSGPGAALSGKEALFEVEIVDVKTKTLPEWNAELANTIREGMTLDDLNAQVKEAVEGEATSSTENNRNEALGKALLERVQINMVSGTPCIIHTRSICNRCCCYINDFFVRSFYGVYICCMLSIDC